MSRDITEKEMKALLASQQGELDAVLMYNTLAEKVKDPEDAEVFRRLAAEEGRHASVFRSLTGQELQPKKTKAMAMPALYKTIGKKKLYPMIAKGEYDAYDRYEGLIARFPEVESVRDDEKRHGDIVMALLDDNQE